MLNINYPAIFEKVEDGYTVIFPDLKGCLTQGDTIEEAYQYAKEALALYLDDMQIAPAPSKIENIQLNNNQLVMLVEADTSDNIEYFKKVKIQETIDKALAEKGYTKYQVAQILGVDKSFIGRIAKGKSNPSVDMAKRIGLLLGVDWQLFYAD